MYFVRWTFPVKRALALPYLCQFSCFQTVYPVTKVPLHPEGAIWLIWRYELSSGSRRVAGSIPPWACRSVPEQDT